MLQSVLKLINKYLHDKALFYLSNDPERALGLEKMINNYHVVSIDASEYFEHLNQIGINTFCLEKSTNELNKIYRSSHRLIQHANFLKYFENQKSNTNYFQTFKISPSFEKDVENLNATLVNTNSKLNRLYENKLSQFNELSKIDIPLPKSSVAMLKTKTFEELVSKLGVPFIIQFDRGHTGKGTIVIRDEKDFAPIRKEFPKRTVKFSELIDGIPYTLNCCIYNKQTFLGGLNYQITGVPSLTQKEGGTVGNDFSYRKGISNQTQESIRTTVSKIGKLMSNNGYRGMFGIDLIVKDEKPYIIEINARQPASVPFYTKIQLKQDQIPLSLLHLAEFLNIEIKIDLNAYNKECMLPLTYSQVFLRADTDTKVNSDIKMGIYRLQSDNSAIDRTNGSVLKNTIFLDEERDKPLIFQRAGYSIDDVSDDGFLILTRKKGKNIKSGNELARLQLAQGAIDKEKLFPWIEESLLAIKDYLK